MQLSEIVEGLASDLRRAGAVGGEETAHTAEVLIASLEPAIGLRMLDALQLAAAELSASAPEGIEVEVRLDGRDPRLTLVQEQPDTGADIARERAERLAGYIDDELARLTLRLPEGLKSQIEQVAVRAGASINSWIVTALAQSLDIASSRDPQPSRRMPRRITGYVQG